jgi:hypothetical protein
MNNNKTHVSQYIKAIQYQSFEKIEEEAKKAAQRHNEALRKENELIKTLEKYAELDDRFRYISVNDIYNRVEYPEYINRDPVISSFVEEIMDIFNNKLDRQILINNIITKFEKYYVYRTHRHK